MLMHVHSRVMAVHDAFAERALRTGGQYRLRHSSITGWILVRYMAILIQLLR
jgi:hypothetical protein